MQPTKIEEIKIRTCAGAHQPIRRVLILGVRVTIEEPGAQIAFGGVAPKRSVERRIHQTKCFAVEFGRCFALCCCSNCPLTATETLTTVASALFGSGLLLGRVLHRCFRYRC